MVIFYRKTDEELLDLTGENKSAQVNAQDKDGNAQVSAQDNQKATTKVSEKAIVNFCSEAKSLKEIIEHFGYKNVRGFREKYINGLLKENKLKQTIPDRPTSRNQKYIANK